MKKMNMVSKFAAVKAMLNGEKVEGFTLAEAMTFIDERIAQTEKKNASGANAERKPTKEQIANEGIKDAIYEGMTPNRLYSVTEIIKEVPACAELTNQKVSNLLRQMMPERIERIEEKRKAYFRVVVAE